MAMRNAIPTSDVRVVVWPPFHGFGQWSIDVRDDSPQGGQLYYEAARGEDREDALRIAKEIIDNLDRERP